MLTFPVTLFGGATATRVYNSPLLTINGTASTYTYTDAPIGVADPSRLLVAVIGLFTTGTQFATSSVTFDGNGGTVQASADSPGGQLNDCRILIASFPFPTGTDCTIAVNLASNWQRAYIAVYSLYNLVSTTPTDSASTAAQTSNSLSVNIDVPTNGIVIAGGIGFAATGSSQTLSAGVTSDQDASDGNNFRASVGSLQNGVLESNRTVTLTGDGSTTGITRALAAVAWN